MTHPPTNGKLTRLPPHSEEDEAGLLGSVLLDPSTWVQVADLSPEAFYDLKHREIFCAMRQIKEPNTITVVQRLRESGQLGACGGLDYLSALPDKSPSGANMPFYLEGVLKAYKRRMIVNACTSAAARAFDFDGDIDELLWLTRSEIEPVFSTGSRSKAVHISDIEGYPVDNDPACLIGKRYLCRRGSVVISGPAGIGKSSLTTQIVLSLAVGRPFFGVTPMRPLRIHAFQAENDEGDMCEMISGVRAGMGLDYEYDEILHDNLFFTRDPTRTGNAFLAEMRRAITDTQPDIVVIDPVLAFIGDDMTKQTVCANFFRVGLGSIAEEFGVAFIIVNHTTKPSNDPKQRNASRLSSEAQYDQAGGHDVLNAIRASIGLKQIEQNLFRLSFTKRKGRAGATHPDGTPTTEVWLRHAQEGIYWEQVDPPVEDEPEDKEKGKPGRTAVVWVLKEFLATLKDEELTRSEIMKRACKFGGYSVSHFEHNIWATLKESLTKTETKKWVLKRAL